MEEEIFLLGFWVNPYCFTDKEYFWADGFKTQKAAVKRGKFLLENGRPHRFNDWSDGECKVFTNRAEFLAATKEAGFQPRIED
jgi:hypothetical protein